MFVGLGWNLQRLFEGSVLFKLQDHLLVLLQMRKGPNLLIFDFSFSYTSLLSFTFYRYVFPSKTGVWVVHWSQIGYCNGRSQNQTHKNVFH